MTSGGRKGGHRGVGPVVISAGPEGCSSSSRLGSNALQLERSAAVAAATTSSVVFNLFVVGPHTPYVHLT